MKIKVECIGEDWGFYQIEDVTDYYNDIAKSEGKEEADRYFTEGTFNELDETDGYVIGWLECIEQSDSCPPQLYQKDFKIVVTHIDETKKETN